LQGVHSGKLSVLFNPRSLAYTTPRMKCSYRLLQVFNIDLGIQ